MFIFTAKLNKRKIIAALLLIITVAAVLVIVFGGSEKSKATSLTAVVKNNEQRVAYLESFGWDVSEAPIEQQTIVIPREFTEVYDSYNTIQKSQGFDLSEFSGREAVRYTYEVTNYPGISDGVVADIIVYRNEIIAGDVQSVSLDGFMSGLTYPSAE